MNRFKIEIAQIIAIAKCSKRFSVELAPSELPSSLIFLNLWICLLSGNNPIKVNHAQVAGVQVKTATPFHDSNFIAGISRSTQRTTPSSKISIIFNWLLFNNTESASICTDGQWLSSSRTFQVVSPVNLRRRFVNGGNERYLNGFLFW